MDILGYVIVKTVMGYELRTSELTDAYVYRSSTFEGVLGYLQSQGYPEPPYRIPLIIEAW